MILKTYSGSSIKFSVPLCYISTRPDFIVGDERLWSISG